MSLWTTRQVILASASPRRLMLLEQIGISPQVMVADVEEQMLPAAGSSVAEMVQANAMKKAQAIYDQVGSCDCLILAADTVVEKDGKVFGKPAHAEEAVEMLRQLSASRHRVLSGAALLDAKTGASCSDVSITTVYFAALSEAEIAAYVATGEPLDKAGAYGMQAAGGLFVERIEGDYSTAVGLSLPLLRKMLARLPAAAD